jgi:phage terminase large subunit-like protein
MTAAQLRAYIGGLDLAALTYAQKKSFLEILEAKEKYEAENMLSAYKPYPKQADFHAAGRDNRERLLMASNQSGKTYSAAAETAMHLTGIYPDDWTGKVFSRPTRGLAAGVTSQLVRDSMQVLLCGYPARPLGQGMIPARCLEAEPVMARSITGAYDTVKVKHVTGGESTLYLRSYDQGREKVQAMTLDFVWLDEEPDVEYYTEALTRTNVTQGPVFMTFTPLKGMSATVSRFVLEGQGHVTTMTLDDVEHYTPEEREKIIAQYPAHEREARTKGIPSMGSGRVFPIAEDSIKVEPFPIPAHWPRLCGIDFGWNHPSGVAWVAWDRDTDTVYVYDCYRAKETLIPVHAAAITSRGAWIPVSWPHDGYQVKDAMHGEQLAQQYRNAGVNMRPEHAAFAETPILAERKMSRISTEAGVQEMLTRMETGKFKVFSHLGDWFEEFRMYHRKEGVIVKLRDDILSATRLTIMDLRHSETEPRKGQMIDHDRRSDGLYV